MKPLAMFNRQRNPAKSADGYQGYCRTCQKEYKLLLRYGLSMDAIASLLSSQGGVCAICEKPLTLSLSGKVSFVVDHCHRTQKVRGILCNACNIILGHAYDSATILRRAITYLDETE